MELILLIYIIVLGLFIGSFLNVVGIRIPKGESIVKPPSHCPNCNHRLGILDLVPVFSYLFNKGQCRYCKATISWLYPLGEAVTALLFIFLYVHYGLTMELAVVLAFTSILIAITISDLLYQLIPDKITFFGMGLFLLIRLFYHPLPLWEYGLGFIIGGGIFWIIAVVSRGGMGGGDIKLMALIGLVLGWKLTLLTIFIASFLGSVIGGILLGLGNIKRGQPIPFGPFIAVGALIVYVWGVDMMLWYQSLWFSV